MVSAVNLGSINMPKMLRHVAHRSSQVRGLTFIREAVYDKEVATHRKKDSSQTALLGPPVNFGYESSTNADLAGWDGSTLSTANTAYHTITPEIVLPGLTMLQSPIVSRSGRLERGGHRISGACTFYAPSLDYIKALPNFADTVAFAELESYDKLIDIERIIYQPTSSDWSLSLTDAAIDLTNITTYPSVYEVDRLRFTLKAPSQVLDYILLSGEIDGSAATLKWDGNLTLSATDFITIDLPISKVEATDTASIYKDGVRAEYTAAITGGFDVDKMIGDSDNFLGTIIIETTGTPSTVELKDVYLYKEAEWRIESIKDYRDEYMQLSAVRVRGERASRRRTYG